jgi:hypothetical protein
MSALERLAARLRGLGISGLDRIVVDPGIDAVIERQRVIARGTGAGSVPADLMQRALKQFWNSLELQDLKNARLVSYGLCAALQPNGRCILEDTPHFNALLSKHAGIDQWIDAPRAYRRCYQGLLRSYFTYPQDHSDTPAEGRKNWNALRDYLRKSLDRIRAGGVEPDWVVAVTANPDLFGASPCDRYARPMLEGDDDIVRHLRDTLGIVEDSWFFRELILSQVRLATKAADDRFRDLLPRLLELLAQAPLLQDRGLTLLLDRYVKVPQQPLDTGLRDSAVEWWRNPWLPSNANRWGGVDPKARAMVADWLKSEFVVAFFEKLAEDGTGDRRRANFWLRYVNSMDNVRFALGSKARDSTDEDFQLLRGKMDGLITPLMSGAPDDNAFVMMMGNLVAVEFGSKGNAFYGYEADDTIPFNLSEPVYTRKNGPNSLKHDSHSLRMLHKDGIHGWDRWEDMFAATLKTEFGLAPRKNPQAVPPAPQPAQPKSGAAAPTPRQGGEVLPYSRAQFKAFTGARKIRVDDLTHKNGNLWARTDDSDAQINKVLRAWNFTYRRGEGWWRDRS